MDHTHNKPKSPVSRIVEVCLEPAHLRRTLIIALVVGTWLTLLNQGNTLWSEAWNGELLIRVLLNYLTPFVVSNLGLLAKEPEDSKDEKS